MGEKIRDERWRGTQRELQERADKMFRELEARHRRRLKEMDIADALRDYLSEEFNCGPMGCRQYYADPLIRRALREIRALRSTSGVAENSAGPGVRSYGWSGPEKPR